MKLNIFKSFNMNKWLQKLEPYARIVICPIVPLLAFLTVLSIWPEITKFARVMLLIFFFLFLISTYVISKIEIRHAFRKRAKSSDEDIRESTYIENSGYNKWISIGLLALVAIILVLTFIARQLPPTPQGYQAFFTAFAGIAALGTGIAIAVFAYQQYKLRQIEHSLLFEPQMLLRSAGAPITGRLSYNNQIYPYRIEWTVLILNTSQQPILIEYMTLKIRRWREGNDNGEYFSLPSCYVLEPEGLEESPFQVTVSTPKRIRWIIEGYNARHDIDDVRGDSNNRRFELIFKVRSTIPQDPSTPIIMETISNPFSVPKNAKLDTAIPFIV